MSLMPQLRDIWTSLNEKEELRKRTPGSICRILECKGDTLADLLSLRVYVRARVVWGKHRRTESRTVSAMASVTKTSADVRPSLTGTQRKRHTKHYIENVERGCARAGSEGTLNETKRL